MRILIVSFALIASSAFTEACPPSPTPPGPDSGDAGRPPEPVAADASPPLMGDAAQGSLAERLCGSLRVSGCQEGFAPNCTTKVQQALDTRITPLTTVNAECLLGQTTKAGVHFCNTIVTCP